jgi:hypothetical protein
MLGPFTIDGTLEELGYKESEEKKSGNYLEPDELASDVDHAHIFRKAVEKCGLRGVYVLRPGEESRRSNVPVVYVCKARDEQQAKEIHRLVWNQGLVPFVLVVSPKFVRLYSGFKHDSSAIDNAGQGLLANLEDFNDIAKRLADFTAKSVDSGDLWRRS